MIFAIVCVFLVDGFARFGWAGQLEDMWHAYSQRVLTGLNPETLAVDTSANWRIRENSAAGAAFQESPVFGVGFGVPYRDYLYPEIFNGNDGLIYIHSAYMWILVKTGLVGSALLLGMVASFVFTLGRLIATKNQTIATPLVALTMALSVVMIASPTPFESSNSVFVGAILAILLLWPFSEQEFANQPSIRSVKYV